MSVMPPPPIEHAVALANRGIDTPTTSPHHHDNAPPAGLRRDVAGPLEVEQAAQAEHTVIALRRALADGVPLMIPGTLGARRPMPAPLVYPALTAVFDRRRDELEREGGGSPDARRVPLPTTASWRRRLYQMLGI